MRDSNNPINYGLKSPYDLYQKLVFEEKRLSSNAEWSNYDFFNFHVTATHLFDDWLKEEKKESVSLRKRIEITPSEIFDVLKVLRDLTNGNKHRTLDARSENKRIAAVIDPIIDDEYSYFFARYAIETSEFAFQVWDITEITLGYFHWLFDDNSTDEFPQEVIKLIENCKKNSALK